MTGMDIVVEALSRELPADRVVVDPDVLGPRRVFNPGKG